jgi:peroxiredoxin
MIAEETKAPDFEASSTGGQFRLSGALEAGPLVLYFYFKADTPG